jgi:hypothetical protein
MNEGPEETRWVGRRYMLTAVADLVFVRQRGTESAAIADVQTQTCTQNAHSCRPTTCRETTSVRALDCTSARVRALSAGRAKRDMLSSRGRTQSKTWPASASGCAARIMVSDCLSTYIICLGWAGFHIQVQGATQSSSQHRGGFSVCCGR